MTADRRKETWEIRSLGQSEAGSSVIMGEMVPMTPILESRPGKKYRTSDSEGISEKKTEEV